MKHSSPLIFTFLFAVHLKAAAQTSTQVSQPATASQATTSPLTSSPSSTSVPSATETVQELEKKNDTVIAEPAAPTPEPTPPRGQFERAVDQAKAAYKDIPSQRLARPFVVGVNAAIFETWVLTKYGATLSYNTDTANTYEIEYLKGNLGFGIFGFDLGGIEEQKVSALWRSYNQRSTLSFFMGMTYNKFDVHLGNEYLESVSGSQRAHVDLAEITTLGATWGFGQRWHTKNGFVWGVDWLTLNLPLVTLNEDIPYLTTSQNPERREQVSDAVKLFKRIPTVGVLKLQLAYSF